MYSKFIFKFQVLSSIYHQYYFLFTLLHFYLWKFFLWPFKWNIWAVNSPSIVFRSRWHLSCQLLKKSHNYSLPWFDSHSCTVFFYSVSFFLFFSFKNYRPQLFAYDVNLLWICFFQTKCLFCNIFCFIYVFFLNGNASFVFKDYIYKEYIFQVNSLFS